MRRLALFLLLSWPALVSAETKWVVAASTLSYFADHALHASRGVSHAARGKAVCDDAGCRFLVAAPVNTFDSGDANRDLHMVQTVRGVKFPMVSVKGALPAAPEGTLTADVDVELAGEKRRYAGVTFTAESAPEGLRLRGVVPMTLKDFKIEAPSLLGMAIKNEAPVEVDLLWRKAP